MRPTSRVARLALTLRSTLVLAALPLAMRELTAQTPQLHPGLRVRIGAPGVIAGRFDGTVIASTPDSLVVANAAGQQVRLPVTSLAALSIHRGRSRWAGAWKGARWGALVGAGLGLAVVAMAGNDGHATATASGEVVRPSYDVRDVGPLLGIMALGGAEWGALIGALARGDRWERVSVGPRMAVTHTGAGVGVGMRVGF